MSSDAKRLEEFAVAFGKIPKAKRIWFECARQQGRVTRFYQALDDCRRRISEACDVMDSLHGVSCSSSGSVAALVRHFALEMKAEGINIDLGKSFTQSIIDAVEFYNDIVVISDKGFNNLEQRVANHYDDPYGLPKLDPSLFFKTNEEITMSIFEKFLNKAVAKPTLIFGQLTDDMTNDDYLAAIRRVSEEIKALDDIEGSKKVQAKVEALNKELKEVTALYDDSDV